MSETNKKFSSFIRLMVCKKVLKDYSHLNIHRKKLKIQYKNLFRDPVTAYLGSKFE